MGQLAEDKIGHAAIPTERTLAQNQNFRTSGAENFLELFVLAEDEAVEAADKAYQAQVRDAVLATLRQFKGEIWLAGGALADVLGWVMAHDSWIEFDIANGMPADEALHDQAHIYGLRAALEAQRLRVETEH
jgi:hypothetical protein